MFDYIENTEELEIVSEIIEEFDALDHWTEQDLAHYAAIAASE